MSAFRPFPRSRGVTLVELMVAMVLGLIVAGGIVTVFMSTSSSNRAQTQLARLQEEGRFAVTRIASDLKMAGAQYCSGTGGIAKLATDSDIALDALRTPRVLAKDLTFPQNTTPWGAPYPEKPAAVYNLQSFFYMRGFECTKDDCTPASPPTKDDGVPEMGDKVGDRVKGAAVLQLRYVDAGRGWAIGGASTITSASGLISSIHIAPKTGEPSLAGIADNELMMLADCSTAQIFQTTGNPDFVPADTAGNFSAPRALVPQAAPRFFRLKTDFRTITYFLQVVSDDGTEGGAKTGALMRCDSGGQDPVCQELVRGAERLDFTYGVEDQNGLLRYLTGTEVDSRADNKIKCPAGPPDSTSTDQGCLWRALKTVEVNVLMDGQAPLYTLQGPDMAYAYSPDGITTPKAPDDRGENGIAPADQGFANQMLRRQFGTVVMMRNYNP